MTEDRREKKKESDKLSNYLMKLRREAGISLKQLCDGLCDTTLINRMEHGERTIEYLLQNRLLTRLGIVPENYESFLEWKEYERWERRQDIVQAIQKADIPLAEELLETYKASYCMEEALEYQFYLAMLVQIKRYQGCDREELRRLLQTALELTVPEIKRRDLEQRVLSLEELNLYIEYMQYDRELQTDARYEQLFYYVEQRVKDGLSMAKIYPKLVYFYYQFSVEQEKTEDRTKKLLFLCERGIDVLGDAKRTFYLWELLSAKEELLHWMLGETFCTDRDRKQWKENLKESRAFREVLEQIYREQGVSVQMQEFCYLYVTGDAYCVAEVISTRRKMFGMSLRELSEGICDTRVVSNLEACKTVPQRQIVYRLMERLGLSTELTKEEIVTESQEAKVLYRKLKRTCNNKEYGRAAELLEQLEQKIPMNNPSNRQVLGRVEANIQYAMRKLSRTEYVIRMKEVLEETISYELATAPGKKYLTHEEISCLLNIMSKAENLSVEKEQCFQTLLELYETQEHVEQYVSFYGFVMNVVSSALGNRGEYEYSDEISRRLLEMEVRNHRISGIHKALYNLMWNEEERSRQGRPVHREHNREITLQRCILLSSLCKDEFYRKGYIKRLSERSS